MKPLILAICLLLAGCTSMQTRDGPLFVQYKYVFVTIPDDMLEVPEPVYKLNPETATDRDAGVWMLDSERRALELEKKLKRIKAYQDQKLQDLKKLPEDDVIKR